MLLVSILYCFPYPLAKLSIFRQSSKKDCQLLKKISQPVENVAYTPIPRPCMDNKANKTEDEVVFNRKNVTLQRNTNTNNINT